MNEMTDEITSRIIFNKSILGYFVSLLTINSFTLRSSAETTVSSSEPILQRFSFFWNNFVQGCKKPSHGIDLGDSL